MFRGLDDWLGSKLDVEGEEVVEEGDEDGAYEIYTGVVVGISVEDEAYEI